MPSRPTRARGLKPLHQLRTIGQRASRPTRARGLKLVKPVLISNVRASRPTRARGLKQPVIRHQLHALDGRAPRGRVD